jgi:hypothetical protein
LDNLFPQRMTTFTEPARSILAALERCKVDPLPVCATDIAWLRLRLDRDDWRPDDRHQIAWLLDAVKGCRR